jgi:hypothetical protein
MDQGKLHGKGPVGDGDDISDKRGLEALVETARASGEKRRGPAPVERWTPAHCGDIDIRIRRDGVWLHEGSPIGRRELVLLFASVLRKDPDGYCLVTPAEKMRIQVDDLPFRAVRVDRRGAALVFTTDVEDEVEAGPEHPLRVDTDSETGEPAPAVHVRGGLEARIARPVFYELVDMAEEVATAEGPVLAVRSNGALFPLGPAGGPRS